MALETIRYRIVRTRDGLLVEGVGAEPAIWPPPGESDTTGVPALVEAALVTLHTDAPADEGDAVPDDETRRGYWGDTWRRRPFGTRLWVIQRQPLTDRTAAAVENALADGFAWMTEDDAASSVEVSVVPLSRSGFAATVVLRPPTGPPISLAYRHVWEEFRDAA